MNYKGLEDRTKLFSVYLEEDGSCTVDTSIVARYCLNPMDTIEINEALTVIADVMVKAIVREKRYRQ